MAMELSCCMDLKLIIISDFQNLFAWLNITQLHGCTSHNCMQYLLHGNSHATSLKSQQTPFLLHEPSLPCNKLVLGMQKTIILVVGKYLYTLNVNSLYAYIS